MSVTRIKPTKTALDLELPPQGGDISVTAESLDQEAHALRVMLDRSENMKVAVGQTLQRLLDTRFAGNRNALRDWYEQEVYEGKAHRAWGTVERYLGTVITHGERAGEVIAEQEEWNRNRNRDNRRMEREDAATFRREKFFASGGGGPEKSEYDQRETWLAQMNYYWFKGLREWQDKWLRDRELRRT
jgi:hypothetical protein